MKARRKKVLLVHPEISRTKYNFVGIIENECLELEYISAVLKEQDLEVILFDRQVEQETMKDKLAGVSPDVVYVCGRSRQENFIKEYCQQAKAYNPEILTIAGGLHVQHSAERMHESFIDILLLTFDIFVLAGLIVDPAADLSGVEGIAYQQNGKWVTRPAGPFDINRLPLPDRTYFDNHPGQYRYLELEHAAHVRTAYSCPYRCRFCYRGRLNNGIYSARKIEAVVDEIKEIKAGNIYLVDDDFLYDRVRVERFVTLVKQAGIKKKYICYGRADFIVENADLMIMLKEIGFYYVLVGLEAIGDRRLLGYQKRSNLDQNIECVRILNETGINIMGMFIIDLDFVPADFRELYRWIESNQLKHTALSLFTPEFGLETYDEYRPRLITDNPSHWDYLHVVAKPFHMSVRRFYFYYYCLLIRLFLRARKDGVYDFIDYGDYIRSFLKNMITKRSYDNE